MLANTVWTLFAGMNFRRKATRRTNLLTCLLLIPVAFPFIRTGIIQGPTLGETSAALRMVGFGQTNKTQRLRKREEPEPPVGGLPKDAFDRFPRLSEKEQQSLKKVEDLPRDGAIFPNEVLDLVRDRHGFKLFDPNLFPGIRLLHADPVVFEVEDFFTPRECDIYIAMSSEQQLERRNGLKSQELRSLTTNGQSQFQQQRTSTTWFHHYASAPELVAKASTLLGVEDYRHWEEPQTVRYRPGERFSWHLDALPPPETGASKGGQRTATVLVYLTNLKKGAGGATAFRDLGPLRVYPKKGKCLVFFPSFGGKAGSPLDGRTLHAGEVVSNGGKAKDKYIAQLWCHKRPYPPAVPVGNSHEAAEKPIGKYMKQWRGTS